MSEQLSTTLAAEKQILATSYPDDRFAFDAIAVRARKASTYLALVDEAAAYNDGDMLDDALQKVIDHVRAASALRKDHKAQRAQHESLAISAREYQGGRRVNPVSRQRQETRVEAAE